MTAPGSRTADPSPSPTAGPTSWNSPPWMSPAITIRSIASHSRSTRRHPPSASRWSSAVRASPPRPAPRGGSGSGRSARRAEHAASLASLSDCAGDFAQGTYASIFYRVSTGTKPGGKVVERRCSAGGRPGNRRAHGRPRGSVPRPILALAGSLSVRCRGRLFRLPRHHPLGEPRHLRDPHELRRLRQLPHEPSERIRLREPVPLLRRESEPAELPLPHGRLGLRLPQLRWGSAVERLHERRMERDEHRRPPRGGEPDVEGVHGGHAEQLLRLELRPLR